MSDKGIPSPFWQPPGAPLPVEVQKEVDVITHMMTPAINKLALLVRDYNLNCFEITGGMHGIGVTLHVHNPKAPHPEMPEELMDLMENPEKLLRDMGLPVPPGAQIHVSAHKLPPMRKVPVNRVNTSPGAAQPPNPGVPAPAEDLIQGIETVLRQMYPTVNDSDVLGMRFSPHHNAAVEIGKIMEVARKRDRDEILRRLTEFLNTFRS